MNGQQNINANTNNGFRDQIINDNITSVRDGIHALSSQLCSSSYENANAMLQGFNGL
jgi:hypothetical protein